MPEFILDNASVIKDTVDAADPRDLEDAKKASAEPVEFVVTDKQVEAVLVLLKDIEAANGFYGIAHTTSVPVDLVRQIADARAERKAKDGIEGVKLEG